jgi:hypothetical protein
MNSAKNEKLSDAEIAGENMQYRYQRKIKQNIKNYEKIGAKTTKNNSIPHLILSGLSSSTLPALPLRNSEISDGVLGKKTFSIVLVSFAIFSPRTSVIFLLFFIF